jgi:hypothetical protein
VLVGDGEDQEDGKGTEMVGAEEIGRMVVVEDSLEAGVVALDLEVREVQLEVDGVALDGKVMEVGMATRDLEMVDGVVMQDLE